MSKGDWSFASYLSKYGKDKADYEKMPGPIQEAWKEEWGIWKNAELAKRNRQQAIERMTPEENDRDDAYLILLECGIPFDSMGEPLGIGE